MLRKIYQALFIVFASTLIANAQNTGAIKGKVLDKVTGEPLPFANVVAELNGNQAGGSQTDFDGNFTIKPLAPGTYNLKSTFVGYTAVEVTGIVVSTDKITFLDLKLSKGVDIKIVEVTEYSIPLIDKGNPSTQKTITHEEIEVAPTRDVKSIAATTGGVTQKDEGDALNVRGSRDNATDYYIDGIRVRGGVNLPQSGIEQITVVTGGVPAQYGDNTGGLISVTTRGPSKDFNFGVELVTSEVFDKYGYNLGAFNVSGPIYSKKGADGIKGRTLAGFFISGEYQYQKDPDPSAIQMYKLKDDVYNSIIENPLNPAPDGNGFVLTTDTLRLEDFEEVKFKQNLRAKAYRFSGKITVQPVDRVDLTFGLNFDKNDRNGYDQNGSWVYNSSLLNHQNYPNRIETNINAFGRITHRLSSGTSDKDKSASAFKNAFYSIQFDISKTERTTQSSVHKDRIFDYGYIGKFTQDIAPSLKQDVWLDANGDTIATDNWVQSGFSDVQYHFEGQNINPVMQNYVEQYYDYAQNNVLNLNELLASNSLGNGFIPPVTYSMWTSPGTPSGTYRTELNSNYRASISGGVDLKNHGITLGFEFEQRVDRNYTVAPTQLWRLMRLLSNQFNTQLDIDNPIYIGDTAFYPRAYNHTTTDANGNTIAAPPNFYENIRRKLGLSNTDYVDIDSYDRSTYSLDLFTPDDLLNDGNSFVAYHGFDYLGSRLKTKPTYEDFFKAKDENGNYTRPIDAFRPIYMAGYLEDNFTLNDLQIRIGVRVDRFDANQKVPVDQLVLYPAVTAGEIGDPNRPSNIGDDYVAYVSDLLAPSKDNVIGYRNGIVWYDKEGEIIEDPRVLAQAAGGVIAPYLKDPRLAVNGTQSQYFNPNESFKDYEPQTSFMPRVGFSFPISDEALFYAHYDVLTQRPDRLRNSPVGYLYLPINQGSFLNNPELKPEKTTDYEIGFSQKLSSSSALRISAFYRELRNQVQTVNYAYAFPVPYQTFGNVDFGTVKGITLEYDLRRTGNIRLTTAYTLQFADGTGSDDLASNRLIAFGSPNLRAIFPYNYDQRHTITASLDYRYLDGKDYNGPMLFGKQILKNSGINFIFKVNSGTPYSRQLDVLTQAANIGVQQVGTGILKGTVNGSRLPWQSKIDVKIDHDITLKFGKDSEKKKTASINIYLLIQNLLNAKNIQSVYRYTGNPNDDGFLASAIGQDVVESQPYEDSYTELYNIKVNNPDNYSLPRRIRLGVKFDF